MFVAMYKLAWAKTQKLFLLLLLAKNDRLPSLHTVNMFMVYYKNVNNVDEINVAIFTAHPVT